MKRKTVLLAFTLVQVLFMISCKKEPIRYSRNNMPPYASINLGGSRDDLSYYVLGIPGCDQLTQNTAKVYCDAFGRNEDYERIGVMYQSEDDSSYGILDTPYYYQGRTTSYTFLIDSLKPNTTYAIQFYLESYWGGRDFSELKHITTLPASAGKRKLTF